MSKDKKLPSVCVIGSGVGGLAISKQLKERGVPFRCYDARDKVGGIWAYTEDPNFTAAWDRLNQNTPRGRYQFSDYPMPDHYPDYPLRGQIQEYLEAYTKHFDFYDDIQLNTSVTSAKRQANGGWIIETSDGEVRNFDVLIVANGHHNKHNFPDYAKRDNFNGMTIHSGQYRHRRAFQDKNVMVVGIGNSGSQIAIDISHAANRTYISTRRGVYVLPHYICGFRFDKFYGFLEWAWLFKLLRWPILHWISSATYRIFVAKNEKFGLPKPDHLIFESLPTLSENFFNRIGDGRLIVKPEVERLDGNTVHFKDGSSEEMDAIVYSTGFDVEFPFFEEDELKMHDNRVPLYKRIFAPGYPDLCFIGLFQAVTFGFLHMMEHQARVTAKYIVGEYALPSKGEMKEDIEKEKAHIEKTFMHLLRNNYQMIGCVYLDDLKTEEKKGYKRARKHKFKSKLTPQIGESFAFASNKEEVA